MNPKQTAQRNKQRERQQRGNDFQVEMRRSWARIPNCWRLRIQDGGGGTRPGDELVLLEGSNILAEHKRTSGTKFELSFLRVDQITGLLDFDKVLPQNLGVVFVSFHNPVKGIDEAYAIRLKTALLFMGTRNRQYITLDELREFSHSKPGGWWVVRLPRIESAEPTYDLEGVTKCYKSR